MSVTRSSEPPVQHREGPDLDALVEQIAAEHPAPVRFLDVDRVRRGGVMGFFAKEQYALSYQVADEPELETVRGPRSGGGRHGVPVPEPVDLEALLGSADACDVRPARPSLASPADTAIHPGAASPADERFADLLLRLAAEGGELPPAAGPAVGHLGGRHHAEPVTFEPLQSTPVSRHRAADETPEPIEPAAAPLAAQTVAPTGVVSVDTAPAVEAGPVFVAPSPEPAEADAHTTPLAALGVPAGWGTPVDEHARAAAVVGAVLALPAPPATPTSAGAVIVLLGGAHDDALRHLAATAASGTYTAHDRDSAVRAVAEIRAAATPGVVVLPLQRASTLPSTIAALQPDLVVLEVEATGKTSDHRRRLDAAAALGLRVDALAVVRASETSSPATVWELGVPILSVDGRTSDVGTWAGLLLAADPA